MFDGLAGMAGIPLNVAVPGRANVADMVWGEMVTENFFTVLGMSPAIGRFFSPTDAPQGANPFAVMSYDGWHATIRRRFVDRWPAHSHQRHRIHRRRAWRRADFAGCARSDSGRRSGFRSACTTSRGPARRTCSKGAAAGG